MNARAPAASRTLRLARVMVSSHANGPGTRLVVWFQGCRRQCEGCINPEMWDPGGGDEVGVGEVIRWVNAVRRLRVIEGVTFTGGEPMLQARAALPLAHAVRDAGLGLVCYTGYRLEDIEAGDPPGGTDLLRFVDLLVDGPFVADQAGPALWRGSRNQRLLFLTGRYAAPREATDEARAEVEVQVGRQGVAMTGNFPAAFWTAFEQRLRASRGG